MALNAWRRPPHATALAYPSLLGLGAVDAAGYSVIGPVLPALAATHNASVAVMGAVAASFPTAMMVGFVAAGRSVRAGHIRLTLLGSLAVSTSGALLIAGSPELSGLFGARALMGLGSGGLWIGVTFATLTYWPGQEYLCMSRIYAAYSAGALLGPALGSLGGTTRPFLAYAALLAVLAPAAATLPRPDTIVSFVSDRAVLRSRRFWAAAVAILLAILAIGAVDGVLPLHFAQRWTQSGIGIAYVLVGVLLAVGSVVAGHQPPARMLLTGALAITLGLTLAGVSATSWVWGLALLLVGLGAGATQTGATGLLLAAVPIDRIVTAMVVWSQLGIFGYLAAPALGGLLAQHLGYAALGLLPATTALLLAALASPAWRHR